jgi:hypothetical protein
LTNTITSIPIINGSTGYTLASNGASWINSTSNSVLSISDNNLTVDPKASVEVKGKMILNGQDLEERLSTIEKVLMIPERDAKLEAKYPKLKKMYDDYIKELGKYRTWETLKGEDNE